MPDNPEQIWFTATGEENGNPLIFRGRQHAPVGIVESDYPNLIEIYWPYKKDGGGMPDSETNAAQVDLEDALAELDSPGISFLMLVVTGNGRKVWHWYAANVEVWMKRLNELLAGHPSYPIRTENSFEPDWYLYHNFISGVSGI